MKTIFYTIAILTSCYTLGNPNPPGDIKRNYAFGVFTYKSILPIDFMLYNIESYTIENTNNMMRHYNPVSFGASFQKETPRFQYGFKMGVTKFDKKESTSYNDSRTLNSSVYMSYKQTQILSSLYGKVTENLNHFQIGLGFEIPVILYGEGTYVKGRVSRNIDNFTKSITSQNTNISEFKTPAGMAFGFGGNFELGYQFNPKIRVGLGISAYILSMKTGKPYNITTKSYSDVFNANGEIEKHTESSEDWVIQMDNRFKAINFGGLNPMFKLEYCFVKTFKSKRTVPISH